MPTGGELLVRALELAGVEVAFGLPGVHNLPAWRALSSSSIRLVGVRHEQTCAYAADGYARASGRLGVALTTTGPGAANTLGGLGEAWASGSPVLVIATDISSKLRRPGLYRGVLHETIDQAAMFAPVTKAVFVVGDAGQIPDAVAKAAALAQEPPSRPVYVEVPTDLLSAEADREPSPARAPDPPPQPPLDRALGLIESAERPLVWAGGGALRAGAGEAVGSLASRLAAPVITTFSARGLLGPSHPCAVGLPPHVPEVGALWDEADLVIGIGTDFDGMMTQNWAQPAPARLIAVNVDPIDAAKNYEPDELVAGDARAVTEALAAALPERGGANGLSERLAAIREAVTGALEPGATDLLASMRSALPDDAIVVCDMCIPGYWLAGFHPVPAPRKLAYPMGWGTLGFAFPAALGAALAGEGPAVSISGDGGFLYACGELATAAQDEIPLTAVVVDDGGYGMLRYDQKVAGDPIFGVDLRSPDFVAMARSFGVEADAVDGLGADFAAALERQVTDARPSLLVARAALDPPPNTSPRWYRRRAG